MKFKKPLTVILLILLMFFQSISGIFGGIGLIIDPSGETLQIPIEWLADSPFNNYLIPGIILFSFLGVIPFFVLFGLWRKRFWAWQGSLFIGVILIIWIIVEIIIIGYQHNPPLQFIYGLIGLLIITFTLIPNVKVYFKPPD
ncbi:MAG: hypothetical protein C4543_01100 [Ignavibacteriales bacterium]|nr:hypothetical protein [Melioribacteraceae bacterium]RJP62970.1 MAG: hypothetical protein C4543_01100 [Ignavibacteriales bacterium]